MTSLARQKNQEEFAGNPLLKLGLERAVEFLRLRSDTYAPFDEDGDSASEVKTHVTGDNLPPVVVNSSKVVRGKKSAVMSVHPDAEAPPIKRERVHKVDQFKNISSLSGYVVSIDIELVEQLQESDKLLDVRRELYVLYTAISYLHEIADHKVAVFVNGDLEVPSPEKFYLESFGIREAGYYAEFAIFGCCLMIEPAHDECNPYKLFLKDGRVTNMYATTKSGANHKITAELIDLLGGILSGNICLDSGQKVEEAVKNALYPTRSQDKSQTSKNESSWKCRGTLSVTDANWDNSVHDLPWMRTPEQVEVTVDKALLTVTITEESPEPIQFDVYASDGEGRAMRCKQSLYPRTQKCHRSIHRSPLYTVTPGTHTFHLEEMFDLAKEEEVHLIVVVGNERKSVSSYLN